MRWQTIRRHDLVRGDFVYVVHIVSLNRVNDGLVALELVFNRLEIIIVIWVIRVLTDIVEKEIYSFKIFNETARALPTKTQNLGLTRSACGEFYKAVHGYLLLPEIALSGTQYRN